ncbi:MAG: type II toxin-antitoxin system RelE/ParE family toxin [Armatimonadetes bacterium]|nr:type II toxin-antitoxin system RelE/ParE family toxin [Armatimonadota bacterium]
MKLVWTEPFLDDFRALPERLQRRVLAKLELLAANLLHPSLRVKRVQGRVGLYEASVNMQYRLIFRLGDDTLVLHRLGTHKVFSEI